MTEKEITQEKNEAKAWEILNSTDLSQKDIRFIGITFTKSRIDDYPFVKREHRKGEVFFRSEYEDINSLRFNSEKEVNLANTMYCAMGDNFDRNDFPHQLKAVFRILGIESNWA